MEVDRHADRALYLQLADVLREDISSGRLKPGERLPSESALISRHQVSRGTAREAIGTLRSEGLVVVEHGRGAFVRSNELDPLLRRVDSGQMFKAARLQFEDQVAEAGRAASIRQISISLGGPGPPELDRPPFMEAEPLVDAWLGFADGRPVVMTRTWRLEAEPPEGDGVQERFTARMPTRDERRLLQLNDGAPVIGLVRVLRAGESIVELSSALLAAGRQSLVFDFSP
ncbi:MAG: GntR family transcriptional regulator [Actinomycetota bacterium]